MSDDDGEGPGLVTTVFISFVLLYFAASAVAPFLLAANAPADFSLGDAVVTRQDAETSKLKNYRSKFDALSSAKIQKKLHNLPAFYLSTGEGEGAAMGYKIYLSCKEAEAAAGRAPGAVVKATTLDQLYYPLILGRATAATNTSPAAPAEVQDAIRSLARRRDDDTPAPTPFVLVPSAAARLDGGDASSHGVDDVPLYVVERLAFAGDGGRPRVPLFTERGEGLTSYARLREGAGGQTALPADPTIRTTTLREVLESMEGGTRPAVDQLEFYGNADDALRADAMMSRR